MHLKWDYSLANINNTFIKLKYTPNHDPPIHNVKSSDAPKSNGITGKRPCYWANVIFNMWLTDTRMLVLKQTD